MDMKFRKHDLICRLQSGTVIVEMHRSTRQRSLPAYKQRMETQGERGAPSYSASRRLNHAAGECFNSPDDHEITLRFIFYKMNAFFIKYAQIL